MEFGNKVEMEDSTDDPADVEVTDVKARHRRSTKGRPVYTPTFLSASWKGMDDRMVQYAGSISY
jgi:hypothetical protein